ncbi:MAG TPA: zinc ribbon domain-containing protein [Bryobacteraceae bacterium]|nr:zinc ribbon domain-containing protein [Bryobacteraceae bacterium]
MNPRCTCGAILPDDARFCHKCGKPQYEEDVARLAAQEMTPAGVRPSVPPPLPTPSGVSFRNSRAVWITFFVAAVTLFAMIALGFLFPPLFPIVLCAAGFAATRLYNQKAKQPLSTAGGARLGWMTGLWLFLAVAVMFAMAAIVVANPEGWEQIKTIWAQIPQASKLVSMSQHDFLMQLLIDLPFFFLLFTLLPGLGGILGAKFSRRRPS